MLILTLYNKKQRCPPWGTYTVYQLYGVLYTHIIYCSNYIIKLLYDLSVYTMYIYNVHMCVWVYNI